MPTFRTGVAAAAAFAIAFAALTAAPAEAARPPVSPPSPGHSPHMGDYAPQLFEGQAKALPGELAAAVARDLKQTPEQYLSEAAAAQDAGDVLTALRAKGVHVVASHLDGTALTVTVPTQADAAAVRAAGADATVGTVAPVPPKLQLHSADALLGGTAYGYITDPTTGSGIRCSVGFNGYGAGLVPQFATAGHCIPGVPPAAVSQIVQNSANDPYYRFGSPIGSPVAGSFVFGGGYDTGLIQITNPAFTGVPAISTWGGGQGAPGAGSLTIRGDTTGVPGAVMCKSGSTSGWTCGHILYADTAIGVENQTVNAVVTDACVLKGDSGGAAVVGSYALGITSASSQASTCGAGELAAFFPMRSAASGPSVESRFPGWQLAVGLSAPTPTVADGGTLFSSSPFQGTTTGANGQTTVSVYYDGRSDVAGPSATVTASASGAWSFALPSTPGTHSYRLVSRWGSQSSAATTGTITVVSAPSVSRISGSDRFDTAVAISRAAYPGTARVVVVASGTAFPDALSAAPAAVKLGGPLLLTAPTSLPASVAAELRRLSPAKILVIGGVNAVSPDVASALGAIAPVTRISGSDRYATSRAVATYAFTSATRVYLATGQSFPDALSAGAAAGAHDDPVVLVPGYTSSVDTATAALIRSFAPSSLAVVGGTASVSAAYAASLAPLASVKRLGGYDRFATAQAVNADAFASAGTVYVASGMTFPDALAGSALAGVQGSPLYVVQSGCLPQSTAAEVSRLRATAMVALGGQAALNSQVTGLMICQ